jgi:hypothetical protein
VHGNHRHCAQQPLVWMLPCIGAFHATIGNNAAIDAFLRGCSVRLPFYEVAVCRVSMRDEELISIFELPDFKTMTFLGQHLDRRFLQGGEFAQLAATFRENRVHSHDFLPNSAGC